METEPKKQVWGDNPVTWKDKILDYEIGTSGIWSFVRRKNKSWKDKILDYEIETPTSMRPWPPAPLSWKDKILDYEIETLLRFSCALQAVLAWKDKILDYEIETAVGNEFMEEKHRLEKIRYSITRLKQIACAIIRDVYLALKR